MITPEQLTLFALPRHVWAGEQPRCGVCQSLDWRGCWGPPGLLEVPLPDGDTWAQPGPDTWHCTRCGDRAWTEHMWRLPRVSARRRRLAAFRVAAAELGPAAADLRQLFARAEGALREVVRG